MPLNFLDKASAHEIAVLGVEDLFDLSTRLKEVCYTQDRRKRVFAEGLRLRFGERARRCLNEDGKDAGTTRFLDGNRTIVANFRKKVDWDQKILRELLQANLELLSVAKIEVSIEERKYNSLSERLQKELEPARTVKISSYDFSFKEEEDDV